MDNALRTNSVQPKAKRSMTPMVLIIVVSLAPIIFALLAYYVPWIGLKPSTSNNYGYLTEPQRPIPSSSELPLTSTDGQPFQLASLKGKWLLVTADSAACPESCVRKLFILRNSHASQGKEVERLARVWFVMDKAPIDDQILEAYKGTHILQASANDLANFLPHDTVHASKHTPIEVLLKQPMWIIDPLGHLMMEFPPEADPIKVRDDIRKLLRNSRIG